MGGACSVVGGKISSEELNEVKKDEEDFIKRGAKNYDDNFNTKEFNNNNKLKRIKSFGNLKKKKNKSKKNINDHHGDHGDDKQQFPTPSPQRFFSGELRFSSADDKVAPRGSSFIGRANFAVEKAVDVLDALGSGMANLNSSGFLNGKTAKGNKIEILAFEVANTITRGEKLLQSLSKENVRFIKQEVIPSEGVQYMVSSDTNVLLSLVASDKREELKVFCKEVTRFGNHCKDAQWHNLDRFFEKMDTESSVYRQQRDQTEAKMQELVTLAEHTSELYHELNACDRFEQDYRQKVEEMKSLNIPRKGEHLIMLNNELRQQKKIVTSLKRKSLWSRKLEEVIEKLVDIVAFIRQEITEVFGTGVVNTDEETGIGIQRLGSAGLALHYANIINQIDNIASRPTSLPPNIRDTLYRGMPESVKTALRSSLRKNGSEELEVPQIKAEMEKILGWLAPMAMNTMKAHQGFGWVGEWANASAEFNKKTAANVNPIRLQTLYHANKENADAYVLTLVTLLHRLISGIKRRDHGLKIPPLHSPIKRMVTLNSAVNIYSSVYHGKKTLRVELSDEDRKLLERMSKARSVPGISKSQELSKTAYKTPNPWKWSRSMQSSPYREQRGARRPELVEGSDSEMFSNGIEAPF